MTNTYQNILKYGLQASYEALAAKDANVLYFCTDSQKIYKGDVDFTESVVIAAAKPATPVVGKVYILGDTNTVEAYVNGAWHVISYAKTGTIDANSTDVQIASAKAVYDYVKSVADTITSSDKVVEKIENKEAGVVKYTTADGVAHDVTLEGVVTEPSYDAESRKFTFPVAGKDPVVVTLGKDIFIDPSAENGYHADTKEIWLYLNDGSESSDPTLIKVPAAGLVDIYTGADTSSIKVTVSEDNKISAAAVVRPDSDVEGEEFTNALKLGDTGLYVDLGKYATKLDVNTAVNAVDAKAEANKTAIAGVKETLDVVNGTDATDGSFRKAIKDANLVTNQAIDGVKSRLDVIEGEDEGSIKKAVKDAKDAVQAEIDVINGDAAAAGSFAKAIADESTVLKNGVIKTAQDTADQAVTNAATAKSAADAAQATADENAVNIAALAAATSQWGTF